MSNFKYKIDELRDEVQGIREDANNLVSAAEEAASDIQFSMMNLKRKLDDLEADIDDQSIFGKSFWENKLKRFNERLPINDSEMETILLTGNIEL